MSYLNKNMQYVNQNPLKHIKSHYNTHKKKIEAGHSLFNHYISLHNLRLLSGG